MFTFDHYSKLVATMYQLPNFFTDGETSRRIDSAEHSSTFTDDKSLVDKSKHIYKKDKQLLTKISADDDLLNAIFYKFAKGCKKSLKGKPIKYTDKFTATKELIVAVNDQIQDFIDVNLTITTCETIGATYWLPNFNFYISFFFPVLVYRLELCGFL